MHAHKQNVSSNVAELNHLPPFSPAIGPADRVQAQRTRKGWRGGGDPYREVESNARVLVCTPLFQLFFILIIKRRIRKVDVTWAHVPSSVLVVRGDLKLLPPQLRRSPPPPCDAAPPLCPSICFSLADGLFSSKDPHRLLVPTDLNLRTRVYLSLCVRVFVEIQHQADKAGEE